MKTPSSNRIILAEDLAQARPFKLPSIHGGGSTRPLTAKSNPLADDPVYQAGVKQGQQEGFKQGFEAAQQALAKEQGRQRNNTVQQLAARADQLVATLGKELSALEHSVADEVVDLSIELARQIVRQVRSVEPEMIVAVAQEAVAALIDDRSSFNLHLNPADMDLVNEALGASFAERGGRLVADPSITAGGCRIVAADAEVDATLPTRWRRVLASIGRESINIEGPLDD